MPEILIADDDAAIRTVLSQALSREGYDVRVTSNASTLWRWVAAGDAIQGSFVVRNVGPSAVQLRDTTVLEDAAQLDGAQIALFTPRIMGNRTGMSPMLIIFSVFFWGIALGGIIGMILAIPLTAFFLVFWRLAREHYLPALTQSRN